MPSLPRVLCLALGLLPVLHAAESVAPPHAELAAYGIYGDKAAEPPKTAPVATTLPLALRSGDRVVFIGNTLFDRGAEFPHFEASLQLAHPEQRIAVRTLAWSADEVDLMPRPDNFGNLHQHLAVQKADVIFAAFGFNESFGGTGRLPEFRRRLAAFLTAIRTRAYNSRTGPRIVLVSPIPNENVAGVPAADRNNAVLRAYTAAMAEVAAEQQVGFADVFAGLESAVADPATDLTFNGVHLEDDGYARFADVLYRATFGRPRPVPDAALVALVADKNRQFFRRYRPLNGFYYTGGRNKAYGYLDFLPAMRGFDVLVDNRDRRTWELAAGQPVRGTAIDDSNLPAMPPPLANRGANEWLTPAAELAAFDVDPRFEVNLFASEEQFPEVAKPIQMRWDTRGRLWVSCSTAYPHVYPGQEPADRIVILEDTDRDGRADRCTVFADNVHIPLSFELADGGVYVSEQPHLTFLKDTDGDDRADFRRQILTGFGTEDSHHSLHDFIRTPDGDLLFRESIFQHSQIETAYGPVRSKNSSWFRLHPGTQRLTAFGSYPNTNPWGVTFDDWGRHVASHPIYAGAFHATNPPYPQQHAAPTGLPAYSGTCGHEFVDFPFWPKEMQGGMVKARYKPTNRIEFHEWNEQEDHFAERYVSDILFSRNLSFIPVDVKFGPRGDLYICDWYNPVKGHMQYSLRDERRDRKSGRIWRIVPKGATLPAAPVFAGAPVPALLELLKSPAFRHRDLAKRELAGRDRGEVARALATWLAGLDPQAPRFRHHQTEALWLYRSIGVANDALLDAVLRCESAPARAAATQQLRYAPAAQARTLAHLRAAAADESAFVRMEAVMAASYLGTREALDAVVGVLALPAGAHLRYAIRTALESEALARHWRDDAAYLAAHPEIPRFLEEQARTARTKAGAQTRNAAEAQFDGQPDLKTVEISAVPERMLFDIGRFEVKAGQPVKLVFKNPDAMQHNLVIVKPGKLEAVGVAGNEMAKDPSGILKHFVPATPDVLHATKLVDPQASTVLRFKAPAEPGDYPYVCTFPGHWVIMNGIMAVRP